MLVAHLCRWLRVSEARQACFAENGGHAIFQKMPNFRSQRRFVGRFIKVNKIIGAECHPWEWMRWRLSSSNNDSRVQSSVIKRSINAGAPDPELLSNL
jgi:hypothetical protein